MDWLDLDTRIKAAGNEFAGGQSADAAGRRHLMKWMGAGMALALTGLTKSAQAQSTTTSATSNVSSAMAPCGSWYIHVHFLAGPRAGANEFTLACFAPGGIMVESDATGPQARFGVWQPTSRGSFVYHMVEFNYDPTTQMISQVVVPNVEFAMSGADQFQSTSTLTTLYLYDPSGALAQTVPIPNVAQVTGQRITSTWAPPSQF